MAVRIAAFLGVSLLALAALGSLALSSGCSTPSSTVGSDAAGWDATAGNDSGTTTGQDGSPPCGFGFGCDAAPDVAYVVCPQMPPPSGSACPVLGEDCEYGSSSWLGCNLVVQCTATGWQPAPATQGCPLRDAGGSCPPTWAEASAIDAGLGMCPAAECQYPEGYCVCMFLCGGGAQRQVDIAGRWYCAPATSECPSPRPLLGTACTEAGAGCMYGLQCGCGEGIECAGGVWQGGATPPCP